MCSALSLLALLAPATVRVAEAAPPDTPAKRSPLLAAMQAELDRSVKTLSAQEPPAYYVGYTITDTQRAEVSGSNGALLSSSENRNRWLEVSVRARRLRSRQYAQGRHAGRTAWRTG